MPSHASGGRKGAAVALLAVLCPAWAPLLAAPAAAQEPVRELPSVAELVPRVERVGEEAEAALAQIRELASLEELEARAAELAERQRLLTGRLDEVLDLDTVGDDRVAALAAEAESLAGRVAAAMAAVSARLERLTDLRGEWLEERELWRRWQERLAADPELQALYSAETARALERIEAVLAAASRELPELARLQRELGAVATENRSLQERARARLLTWREDLFRRSAPVLLSAEHRRALGPGLAGEIAAGLRAAAAGPWRLDPRHLRVLLFQAALLLAVAWLARRLRPRIAADSRWAAVARHPWAVGVLAAATAAGFLPGPLPPLGRLVLIAAVAGAAVLVASGLFRNPLKRRVVYGVSGLYLLLAALDAAAFPLPLLRPVVAGLAAAGALVLMVAERRAGASAWAGQRLFRWGLRLGAAALAVIALAEVLGYHLFALWLLETGAVTAFVLFVVSFLVHLARGAVHLALRSEAAAARFRFLDRVGAALADRLVLLFRIVLVGWAAFYVASIWDLVESPGAAWRSLLDAGVEIGERRLTVGRALLSVVAVYLAFVSSWVLRGLLDQTFFERRRLERGIRDSIATLLHYAVIVVGVFVGLSVLGLDLTNLALIAGALGVGIGFGLQNVVNNFVSGLILLFERPVRVGDIVVLGEDWGTVERIGMRSTVIVTFNGAELIVPNGDLISQRVTNWTLSTPRARLVLPVGVAYGNDPERVIAVLQEIGGAYPLALADPAPSAIFTGFGDSSLDFELRIWLGAFEHLLAARSEIAAAITRRFAEEGIEIPFPQRDLHVRSVAPEAAGKLAGGPGPAG